MFAELIYRPISGQYPEKHFGDISPNNLWVKFTDKDYQEWVGSFQQGWEHYATFILHLDNQEKAFVVAGGESFLVDLSARKQLNSQKISEIKSAIANEAQTIVYFSSGYDLQFIDTVGNVSKLLNDYIFDDIELIQIKDEKLYAKYWEYQRDSQPFFIEINLVTREVKDTFFDTQ